VLRPKLSEARVAFIQRCLEGRRVLSKKNSLAMLGYRRSTAAPLQPYAPAWFNLSSKKMLLTKPQSRKEKERAEKLPWIPLRSLRLCESLFIENYK